MKLIDLLKSYALTGYVGNPCHKISIYCKTKGCNPNCLWETDRVLPSEWEKWIKDYRLADRQVIKWGFGCHIHVGFELVQTNDVRLWLWVEVEE